MTNYLHCLMNIYLYSPMGWMPLSVVILVLTSLISITCIFIN